MIRIGTCPKKLNEGGYKKYMENKGYKCIKLSRANRESIIHSFKYLRDYYNHWAEINDFLDFKLEKCFKVGSPDFLIIDRIGNYWLCEFKSKNDFLSVNQLSWLKRNEELPIEITIAVD
ncbi:hypothetical protein LCGC14_0556520 [marine sediment metagenome]|uniref:VRR-NUC domain-containing protein n=1 Tax=marine sediment metagenome TaxID=412755 RepID=A0A0F9RTD7_9ZZZZ